MIVINIVIAMNMISFNIVVTIMMMGSRIEGLGSSATLSCV